MAPWETRQAVKAYRSRQNHSIAHHYLNAQLQRAKTIPRLDDILGTRKLEPMSDEQMVANMKIFLGPRPDEEA